MTTPNKSEGAEWEREFDERDRNATFEKDAPLLQLTDAQRAWFKAFIAHQRQQAVAEFARELLNKTFDVDGTQPFCITADDIHTIAKERGIDLTN